MKTISKIYLLGLGIVLMQGCGRERESKAIASSPEADKLKSEEQVAGNSASKETESADTTKMNFIPSSASKIGKIDSIKKFIRTADIKFKVKNVERSTYRIEDIVNHFDGFVINTHLNCRVNYTESYRIKEDSVMQRMHYVVENNMTFRVPKTLLDTTLKQIVSQIDFLDYRIIKAEDVSFAALRNKLSKKRFAKYDERVTNAINTNKTKNILNAENSLLSTQEQADENEVANLELNDKVEYSTVQLLIYQDEKTKRDIIFSEEKQPSYKPSFGKEFSESISFGWQVIEFIVLLIIKLWPIILIALGIYVLVKRLRKKEKVII